MLSAAVVLSPVALMGQMMDAAMMQTGSQPGALPGAQVGPASTSMNHAGANPIAANQSDSGAGMGEQARVMKDKMFVRKASEGGMAEVQIGQLAVQKASNNDIKQFAQKMVDDHTALNESMKPIADNLGVSTPRKLNKMDQAEYDRLNALSGDEFDKAYLTAMVQDHRKDLHEFRQEEADATDPQLKEAVTKGEGLIQEHLKMVNGLAKANGVDVPRGPRAVPSGE
jgi:putative membrane protein